MQNPTSGTRFEVSLGNVDLPALVAKRVESDIRSTVLTALARLDTGGIRRIDWHIRDPFGQTYGMIMSPDSRDDFFDPVEGGVSVKGGADIRDHAIVVGAVMENAIDIIRVLGIRDRSTKPSGPKVLESALKLSSISEKVKEAIRKLLEVHDAIGDPMKKIPTNVKKSLAVLKKEVSGKPLYEQAGIMRSKEVCDRIGDDEVIAALPFAAQVLEDGAESIYSEDNSFFSTFSGPSPNVVAKKDKVDGLKDADYVGGVVGGAAGTVLPGPGTAGGAALGAASSSAGYAIAWAIDSIFD